ncbi:unnamed protein product [Lactuca saligna]|uniref:Uncharacterized protein n=1 Tax=Lactuca saligna TaxID=75948 RepID=A0AA36EIW5_LACSI|nr:unnamed protein product [Lactuca saligna]
MASFDWPTDTLLVGQSSQAGGTSRLTSRASAENNIDGAYSLVMEPYKPLALYYRSTNTPRPTLMLYWTSSEWFTMDKGSLTNLTLTSVPDTDQGFLYSLRAYARYVFNIDDLSLKLTLQFQTSYDDKNRPLQLPIPTASTIVKSEIILR